MGGAEMGSSDLLSELDTATHTRNVLAFMRASYAFSGLTDQVYTDMVAEGVDAGLLLGLYPYDVTQILTIWDASQQRWFKRRNRWDEFTHRRMLNAFADAVFELQRYMPSLWTGDVAKKDSDFGHRIVRVDKDSRRIFVMPGTNRMSGNMGLLLADMLKAAAFVAADRALDSVVERQVRLDSKATSNYGFETALANFFETLGKLLDLPVEH